MVTSLVILGPKNRNVKNQGKTLDFKKSVEILLVFTKNFASFQSWEETIMKLILVEIKSEFPRVKQKYTGFDRLGHLQLEAEKWKKPRWSNHTLSEISKTQSKCSCSQRKWNSDFD